MANGLNRPGRRLSALTAVTLLLGAGIAAAQTTDKPPETTTAARPLKLVDCLALAHQNQPLLIAARTKLQIAEHQKHTLDSAPATAHLTSPDLPVRRQQAGLAVELAAANLQQRENDMTFAVTRLYFSLLHARAQLRVTGDLIRYLENLYKEVEKIPSPKPTERDADPKALVMLYLESARVRHIEAEQGVELALAALREAVGVDAQCLFVVADEKLPRVQRTSFTRQEILELALQRRPELAQARAALQMYHLEIEAQCRFLLPGAKRTFASGADIHAKSAPEGVSTPDEYRPGSIPFEMPVTLAGTRSQRMKAAEGFEAKAAAIVEKTRQLIALEAESWFLNWQEASRQLPHFRAAVQHGTKLLPEVDLPLPAEVAKAVPAIAAVLVQTRLIQRVLLANTEADHNRARLQELVTLAGLERITGCGLSEVLGDKVVITKEEATSDPARLP